MQISTAYLFCILLLSVNATYNWSPVDNVIQQGINQGIFSGCVLAVGTHNATLLKKAYGTISPKRGLYAAPVSVDMKFDINYLTLPIGINSVLMEQYDLAKINTTSRVSNLFFDFDNHNKRPITLQNLLEHNSGLQAFYTAAYPKTPADLLKAINNISLEYTIEAKFQFSEIGPIVLGEVIQKLKNDTLQQSMFQLLTVLGMRDTSYTPTTPRQKIVPGGFTDRIAQGTPFNRITHFINDSTGVAGLFSTAADVLLYNQFMLNKGKLPLQARVFSEEVIDRFLNVSTYKGYNNTRMLGWDSVPAKNPPCGTKFSPSPFSFGLSDISGSYTWTDRKKNVTIVLLANGNFPYHIQADSSTYQGLLSDAIMTVLGY